MFTTSQTSGSEAKGLVDGQTFGCRPGGPESADGWEIAAKAFGPEARPGNDAGPPTRQAFVATLPYDGTMGTRNLVKGRFFPS